MKNVKVEKRKIIKLEKEIVEKWKSRILGNRKIGKFEKWKYGEN